MRNTIATPIQDLYSRPRGMPCSHGRDNDDPVAEV
jgi:hypothetical protein